MGLLFTIQLRSGGDLIRIEYYNGILKTLIYIENNLTDELSLSKLAAIACFSEFHFHRIFQSTVGLPVAEYAYGPQYTINIRDVNGFLVYKYYIQPTY